MKLKEGLKKEDFFDCYFHVEKKQKNEVKTLLSKWGFEMESYVDQSSDKVLMYQNIFSGEPCFSFTNASYLNSWKKIELSDLIEEEQPKPKYVKCIEHGLVDLNYGESLKVAVDKHGLHGVKRSGVKIYLYQIDSGELIDWWEPATEEEYLSQQPDPEEEANSRNKKLFNGVYSALKGMGDDWLEYYKTKIKEAGYYLITDKQIEELYNGLLSTEHPAADAQIDSLKFLFPEAECFKTFKIGQKFRWKEDGEIWTLNHYGDNNVGFNAPDGFLLRKSCYVKDIQSITKEELENIRPDIWGKLELIK